MGRNPTHPGASPAQPNLALHFPARGQARGRVAQRWPSRLPPLFSFRAAHVAAQPALRAA
jgi:hypothetical protein